LPAAFFTAALRPAIVRFAIAGSPEVWPRNWPPKLVLTSSETRPVGSLTEARKFCRLFCLALQR
jgi:hypothetical protein